MNTTTTRQTLDLQNACGIIDAVLKVVGDLRFSNRYLGTLGIANKI